MKHKRNLSIAMAVIVLLSLCAVYATTSVSAVNINDLAGKGKTGTTPVAEPVGSPPPVGEGINNAKTSTTPVIAVEAKDSRAAVPTPDLTGSPIAAGTGPASCIRYGTTSMYVFVKGYDGACWYRIWSTSTYTWSGSWVSLGGSLTSSPTASSSTEGGSTSMAVLWRHTDGSVHGRWNYNGAWWGEITPGGNLGYVSYGTGPSVALSPNRVDLFCRGSSGYLYKKTFTSATGWQDWKYVGIGGLLGSSPSAVYRDSGWIEVGVRGTNGAVYNFEYYMSGNSWTVANDGGGCAVGTAPAYSVYGSTTAGTSRLDIFVAGTNGYMYQKYWKMGTGWTGWTNLVGGLETSPCASTFTYFGTIDIVVFTRGTNGLLYQKDYYTGVWHNWKPGIDGPP